MGSSPNGLECCGMMELAGIRFDDSPEESLMNVEPHDQGVVIFSDVREYNKNYAKGRALAKLITSAHLGVVVELPPTMNPNTSHSIKAWMWKVAPLKLKRWQKAEKKKNPTKYHELDNYWNPWRN